MRRYFTLVAVILALLTSGCQAGSGALPTGTPAPSPSAESPIPTRERPSPTSLPTQTPVTATVEKELPRSLKIAHLEGDAAAETAIEAAVDLAENNPRALANRLAVVVVQEVPKRAGVTAEDVYLAMTADKGLVALGLKEGSGYAPWPARPRRLRGGCGCWASARSCVTASALKV